MLHRRQITAECSHWAAKHLLGATDSESKDAADCVQALPAFWFKAPTVDALNLEAMIGPIGTAHGQPRAADQRPVQGEEARPPDPEAEVEAKHVSDARSSGGVASCLSILPLEAVCMDWRPEPKVLAALTGADGSLCLGRPSDDPVCDAT